MFVQGGRIFKDTTFKLSPKRLLITEFSLRPSDVSVRLLCVYKHFYAENVSGDKYGTGYEVPSHELRLQDMLCCYPDTKHFDYKWFEVDELLQSNRARLHSKWYLLKKKSCLVPSLIFLFL